MGDRRDGARAERGDDHQRVHARGAEVASRGCDRGWCEMERVPWSTVARVDVAGVWQQSSGMDKHSSCFLWVAK